ncbi:MAG: hypothetical protein JXA04_08985 [Gammaproteobacteria bacterium]|nr:hypothetical protein [Gammaproteobacteria bacterium]
MNSRFTETLALLLILLFCPLLTVHHASAFAAENSITTQDGWKVTVNTDDQAKADANGDQSNFNWSWQNADSADWLKDLDEAIDNHAGWSDEHKAKIKRDMHAFHQFAPDDWSGAEDVIVPLAGILFAAVVCLIPVFIVALVLIFKHRRRRQHLELISKFVENGQEVPRELLIDDVDADVSGDNANVNMRRGIALMGIGVGLLIALGILVGWNVGALGFIPFFIGLARVIIWKLDSKTTVSEPAVRD